MSGKNWCINLAPFLEAPNGKKLFELSRGAIVEPTGQTTSLSTRGFDNLLHDIAWMEVRYQDGLGMHTGWVRSDFFDEYVEKFPMNEVVIPSGPTDPADPFPYATGNPNDAAQDLVLGKDEHGKELVKFNLCGELCVAFVTGVGIKEFLKKWKGQPGSLYAQTLGGASDKTTDASLIKDMLKPFDFSIANNNVADFTLTEPTIFGGNLSPGKFKKKLQTHYLIARVIINRFSGKLIPDDSLKQDWTGHWVVLDKITPNASDGGRVEIYNPFMNRRQEYSYNEFMKSLGPSSSYTGIWVKRKQEQLLENIGQMNRKWCVVGDDLRDMPGGAITNIKIDPGAILVCNDNPDDFKTVQDVPWRQVTYKGKKGWIRDSVLEDFMDRFREDEVVIQSPTEDENDAKQYMTLEGGSDVKNNMCGELCAAFIIGIDIDGFVKDWKVKAENFYNLAIKGTVDKPTGLDSLESMFRVEDYKAEHEVVGFEAGLKKDPILGRTLVSPGKLKKMLETHYLVAGVKIKTVDIDKFTARLSGQGTGHWVVVDKITTNGGLGGNGGWVEIYNPYPNKRQEYSYDEFMRSFAEDKSRHWFSGGLGLWVKRKT